MNWKTGDKALWGREMVTILAGPFDEEYGGSYYVSRDSRGLIWLSHTCLLSSIEPDWEDITSDCIGRWEFIPNPSTTGYIGRLIYDNKPHRRCECIAHTHNLESWTWKEGYRLVIEGPPEGKPQSFKILKRR